MKKSSLLFLLLSLTTFIFAQQRPSSRPVKVAKPAKQAAYPSGKVIGDVFSDFYYVVNEPQFVDFTKGTNGRNEFYLRRAHFGYEHMFNRDFTGRILLDATDGVNLVREANVEWGNIFPMHFLTIGMMQTAAERTTERIWGYRSLDAMVLNRQGFAHEFDMGIEFGGKFDPQGNGYYSLAAANGSGTVAETNKVKKYSLLLGFVPERGSALEIYADYENFALGQSAITGKLFYGIGAQRYAFGVELFYRMSRKFVPITGDDITPAGGSLFSWFEMTKGLRGVIRVDGVDDDLKTSGAGWREVYVNAGLDITPIPEVHIIPNVYYVKYLKKGSAIVPADVIIARLTAAVYFPTFH